MLRLYFKKRLNGKERSQYLESFIAHTILYVLDKNRRTNVEIVFSLVPALFFFFLVKINKIFLKKKILTTLSIQKESSEIKQINTIYLYRSLSLLFKIRHGILV